MPRNNETTHQEILEAINDFSSRIDKRFDNIEGRMATKEDLGKQKLDILDAVDYKLANLKGDLVVLMRGEDKKLLYLVQVLKNKKVLTEEETREILKLQPFPQAI